MDGEDCTRHPTGYKTTNVQRRYTAKNIYFQRSGIVKIKAEISKIDKIKQ